MVLLPVLPDQGYGPGESLNPYKLWWLVVMISGISFVGYFAIKIAGPQLGTSLTALFGGIIGMIGAITMLWVQVSKSRRENTEQHAEGRALVTDVRDNLLDLHTTVNRIDRKIDDVADRLNRHEESHNGPQRRVS